MYCRAVLGLDAWRPWDCDPVLDGNCTDTKAHALPGENAPSARTFLLLSWKGHASCSRQHMPAEEVEGLDCS